MSLPTHSMTFQTLLLQAADKGRGTVLFGESLERAREAVPPFLVGERFPDVYLEHPLIGEPSLDVTVLYGQLEPGLRVDSPAAGEHGAMLDFQARARKEYPGVACGFELDLKTGELPVAGVHFQPRRYVELVEPFCKAVGEEASAKLYLDQVARMPKGWPLSFFGMFRGRPGSPLRVCGYLGATEKEARNADVRQLAAAFDAIGFSAYDDAMLAQVSELMAVVPGTVDFQFDVFPDGKVGDVFALDVQFGIEKPELVTRAFDEGNRARVMKLLEDWGVVDERWRVAIRSAFARAIPVELDDGRNGRYAFTLMPQWLKVRWTDGVLQPAKLYHLACASMLDGERAGGQAR